MYTLVILDQQALSATRAGLSREAAFAIAHGARRQFPTCMAIVSRAGEVVLVLQPERGPGEPGAKRIGAPTPKPIEFRSAVHVPIKPSPLKAAA